LFRSGPAIQRRVKGYDYKSYYDNQLVRGNLGYRGPFPFGRESSPFSVLGAYGILDRMARYSEFAEMEYQPEIAAALNIFADETAAGDEKGKAFHLFSKNPEVKKALEELFYDILNIDFNLRPWIRNLVKYGDFFLYNEVIPDIGIVNVQPIPVNELEREEGFDQYDPYAVRYKWLTRGNRYLENWQITHMRVLGNDLFLPYGTCHEKTTKILTEDGLKEIQHIKVGDRVVSFDLQSQQKVVSPVLGVKNSGFKPCFEIRTKHNFLRTSKEHQILIWDASKDSFDYKSAGDLRVGDMLIINTTHSAKETNVSIDRSRPNEKNKNGYWNSSRYIPENVTPEFARLFGFLLGDGWISGNQVCFANGVDDKQNIFYASLLEKFTGKKPNTSINQGSQTVASSKMLTIILQRMGFAGKATTKRIPSWVYATSAECRKAFLQGMHDADGSSYVDKWKCERHCFELSNYELIKDLKTLAQTLGYKTGKITKRKSRNVKGRIVENGILREFKQISPSYMFYWFESQNKQIKKWSSPSKKSDYYITEPIVAIESVGSHETYDIYVQDSNHNFYANGIVTHNSLLEPARRIWRQLMMMEDSMLVYRVVRSPERRVFYIDVGNVAPNDVPSYMEAVKQTMRSRDVVDRTNGRMDQRYNPLSIDEDYFIPVRGGQTGTKIETLAGGQNATAVDDIKYLQQKLFAAIQVPKPYLNFDENLCLVGTTKISMLDGTESTIEEIVKSFSEKKEMWTYSIDTNSGAVVPGKIINAWKTKEVNEYYKVTIDNGEVIECTGNHPFLLRNGEYVRADSLKPDMSLMPVYRKLSSKTSGDKLDGYEMLYDNQANKWRYTHQVVVDALGEQSKCDKSFLEEGKTVVHHADFNKRNNMPDNLIRMGFKAHGQLHGALAKKNLLTIENREKIAGMWRNPDSTLRKNHMDGVLASWKSANSVFRKQAIAETNRRLHKVEKMHKRLSDLRSIGFMSGQEAPNYKKNPDIKAVQQIIFAGTYMPVAICKQLSCSMRGLKDVVKQAGYKNLQSFIQQTIDQSVIKLPPLKRYRIFVDLEELANIAATSKTRTEFYIKSNISRETFERHCRKKGIIPNEWFTLNLNKYNHKVIAVEMIKTVTPIPVYDITVEKWSNFLLSAGVVVHNSAKASLAQQDVRFSRTISVLQRVILSELNKMAMIHLYSKGFDGEDLIAFELKLSNPSTVAMQQKLEAMNTKFDIAGKAKETKLVDQDWIQKKLLDLTDDDIIKIEAGIRRDKIREVEIEAIAIKENLPEKNTTTGPFDPSNYVMAGADVKKNPPLGEPVGGNANTPIQPKNISNDMQAVATSGVSIAGQPSASPDAESSGLPIKATPFLSAAQHNKRRRVGMGGRNNLAMPDFKDMLSGTNKNLTDINDKETLNLKSQFTTISEDIDLDYKPPPVISRDIKNLMNKLDIYFEKNGGRRNKKILTEADVNLSNLSEENIFEMETVDDEIVINSYNQSENKDILKEEQEEENQNNDFDLSILE